MMWQPIETAPKDGRWFMIWVDDRPEVGRYMPLGYHTYEPVGDGLYRAVEKPVYDWDGFNNFHAATHWADIEPPK